MKKILTVLGARPQFIKAAALSGEILKREDFQELIVHTGQHFDANMSRVFFDELGIPQPKYNLNIHSLTHGAMTGKMLPELEQIMLQEKPDVVVVYGDTNSTLAGALTASKLHMPIAHVEAGLRSQNMLMPEEVNRVITDKLSSFLFCPSAESSRNLLAEGMPQAKIHVVGDIMLDSLNLHRQKANSAGALRELGIKQPYVLATIHRQENIRDRARLGQIFKALAEINKYASVVLPVHPALQNVLPSEVEELKLIEPQSYLKLLGLLEGCELVLTDSGGLQKEAYYMQKYCITMRDETEWVELVEADVNKVVGAKADAILDAYNVFAQKKFAASTSIYGEGETANKILDVLKS